MANIPTVNHSEATPAGTDYIREGDDRIREFKTQVREIIAVDHKMDSSGQGATWGMHQLVTFIQGASPAAVADKCILFAEDVAAVPQVKCKHEAGYEEQITGIGKYDQNVVTEVKSDTTVDVDALQINIQGQVETSLNVTINVAGTGANGIDAGALAASTWYYVWAIYDTTNSVVAGLLSTSSTAPTMPTNYVLKRLIGYVKSDGDSDLLKSTQFMNDFMYDIPINKTTTTVTNWTALDCSSAIPTGVRKGIFGLKCKTNQISTTLSIRPTGSTWSTPPATVDDTTEAENGIGIYAQGTTYIGTSGQRTCMTDSARSIDYILSEAQGGDTSIDVEGFICGLF